MDIARKKIRFFTGATQQLTVAFSAGQLWDCSPEYLHKRLTCSHSKIVALRLSLTRLELAVWSHGNNFKLPILLLSKIRFSATTLAMMTAENSQRRTISRLAPSFVIQYLSSTMFGSRFNENLTWLTAGSSLVCSMQRQECQLHRFYRKNSPRKNVKKNVNMVLSNTNSTWKNSTVEWNLSKPTLSLVGCFIMVRRPFPMKIQTQCKTTCQCNGRRTQLMSTSL